jgi:dTMP kinase
MGTSFGMSRSSVAVVQKHHTWALLVGQLPFLPQVCHHAFGFYGQPKERVMPIRGWNFIVFEGGEGSGKDTQVDRLKNRYADDDSIVFTREPGGTEIGEKIRSLLLSPDSKGMTVRTELMLFLAARAQLVEQVIRPALEAGKTVISNRFELSTIAYQIYGRERHQYHHFLVETGKFVTNNCVPSAYLLLDVTPEVGLLRVANRNDGLTRFDAEKIQFHRRVREGYLEHVNIGQYHKIINADASLDEVSKQVDEELAHILVP